MSYILVIKYKNYSNISQNAQKIPFPLLLQLLRKIRLVWVSTTAISNPNVHYTRVTPSNCAKTHSQKHVRANTYICITYIRKPTSNSKFTPNSDLFQKKKDHQKSIIFKDFTFYRLKSSSCQVMTSHARGELAAR